MSIKWILIELWIEFEFIVIPSWFYVKYKYGCIGNARVVLAATFADVILISLFFNFYYQQYTRNKNAKAAAAAAAKKEEPVAAPAETKVDDPKKSESKKKEIETYLNDSLGCLAIAFLMFGVVIYFLSSFN